MIECFLTNIYSVDVMAPFCLEMKKRGYDCHLALNELFWKVSYGEHFDIQKTIQQAKKWGVELKLKLNYNSQIAVTQYKSDWSLFNLYKNLKAKISYGIGLNKKTSFAENDFNFDLYFIHGDFERKLLELNGVEKRRIVKIGFPKLKYQSQNYFVKKIKPIITYLPTWDEFKCIDLAIEILKDYSEKYQIYIKPHPLQSKEDLKKFNDFQLLDKNITIKSIVEFSDYIIGDLKSGAIFDALYYNPKLPIITLSKKENLKYHYDLYKEFDLIVCEKQDFKLPNGQDKIKIKNYCFDEEFTLNFVEKISQIGGDEIEILKSRLEKTYKENYNRNDK